MAKPDLSNGYLQLAHELFAAVMVAPLPKEARIVLFEVFAQVYGYEKAKVASLSPTDIARRTGLAKPNVARGIAFLLSHGVLAREGLDAYRFVKDYDAWGADGVALIPPRLSAYAAFAPELAGPPRGRKGAESDPDGGRNPVIESDNRQADSSVFQPEADVDALSKKGRFVIETDNAIPYMETENVVVVDGKGPVESLPLSRSGSDNAPSLRVVKPGDPPAIWARRPFRPDPAELARVKDLVEAIDPHAYLGQKVQAISTLYPLEWIEAAFTEAAGKADRIAYFANNTLVRWWRQGQMEEPEALEPRTSRPPAADPYIPAPRQPRLSPAAAKHAEQVAAMRASIAAKKAAQRDTAS